MDNVRQILALIESGQIDLKNECENLVLVLIANDTEWLRFGPAKISGVLSLHCDAQTRVAYLACPDPNEDLSSHVDIASSYLKKTLVDSAKTLKMMFVLDYDWLTPDGVAGLLKRVVNLLDVGKHEDSIGLMVSHAPDESSDHEIFLRMNKILSDIQESIIESPILHLIDLLLRRSVKVGVWRNSGSVRELTASINEATDKDLAYSYSDKTRKQVTEWLEGFREEIMTGAEVLAGEVEKFYDVQERTSKDYQKLLQSLSFSSSIAESIDQLVRSDINVNVKPFVEILNRTNYLALLKVITDSETKNSLSEYVQPLQLTFDHLKESADWLRFLFNFYSTSSTYTVQESKSVIFEGVEEVTRYNFGVFMEKVTDIGVVPGRLEITDRRLEMLNDVIKTVLDEPTIVYWYDRLQVKGRYVLLDKVVHRFGDARRVEIIASEIVFINTDINAVGSRLNLAIMAPVWQVIGLRSLNFDGSSGFNYGKAESGIFPGDDGFHGKPGQPGGAGGNFLGVGYQFPNGDFLVISSSGGQGGRGEDGGDGAVGGDGHAPLLYIKGPPKERLRHYKYQLIESKSLPWYKSVFAPVSKREVYRVFGTPGEKGGDGGIGGAGGKGGRPGEIKLVELGDASKIRIIDEPGEEGENGISGEGAPGGTNGDNLIVQYRLVDPDNEAKLTMGSSTPLIGMFSLLFNKYEHEWSAGIHENRLRVVPGKYGSPGPAVKNREGQMDQQNHTGYDLPGFTINYFRKKLIEDITPITRRHVTDVLEKLERTDAVTYDAQAFVHEIENLPLYNENENQLPLYRSLQRRVIRYAESKKEKLDLVSRKILSYAYATALSHVCKTSRQPNNFLSMKRLEDVAVDQFLKEQIHFKISEIEQLINATSMEADWSNDVSRGLKSVSNLVQFLTGTAKAVTEYLNASSGVAQVLSLEAPQVPFVFPQELVQFLHHGPGLAASQEVRAYEKKLQSNLIEIRSNMIGYPVPFLSGWYVEGFINYVKRQGLKLSETLDVDERAAGRMRELDELMTMLVDVFERIRLYQKHKELADYVSDLHSKTSEKIELDEKQKSAMRFMDCVIRSNAALSTYVAGLNTFQNAAFPFARDVAKKFFLPMDLNICSDVFAIENPARVWAQMRDYNTSLIETAKKIPLTKETFFVWSNQNNRQAIFELLSGKQINLKADISQVHAKNAVKLREIEVKITTANVDAAYALRDYNVTSRHWGNSYYRCVNDVFSITSASVNQENHGHLVSPYAMWSIKLDAPAGDFEKLTEYQDDVNLELTGTGEYLLDDEPCYDHLEDFYHKDIYAYSTASTPSSPLNSIFNFLASAMLIKTVYRPFSVITDKVRNFLDYLQQPPRFAEAEGLVPECEQTHYNNLILAPVALHLWKKHFKKTSRRSWAPTEMLSVTRRRNWSDFLRIAKSILISLRESGETSLEAQYRDAFEFRKSEVRELLVRTHVDSDEANELETNMIAFLIDLQDDMEMISAASRRDFSTKIKELNDIVTSFPNFGVKLRRARLSHSTSDVPVSLVKPEFYITSPNFNGVPHQQIGDMKMYL